VIDDGRRRGRERASHRVGVDDVGGVHARAAPDRAGEVLDPPRREVVEDGDVVALGLQGIDERRADEARAARDEDVHANPQYGVAEPAAAAPVVPALTYCHW
jgi:hypothetical protein